MNFSQPSIGFLQAAGVFLYCAIVSGIFRISNKFLGAPPEFLGTALMLVIFVFSAAITGSIVFGYPAYLVFNRRVKEALSILAYTLIYLSAFIIATGIVLYLWK